MLQLGTFASSKGSYNIASKNCSQKNLTNIRISRVHPGHIKPIKTNPSHGLRVHSQINFIDGSSSIASVDLEAPTSPQNTPTTEASTLPALWPELADRYGDALALLDPHASPPAQYSFIELSTAISTVARGLSSLGLTSGDHCSLFSENSSRWLITDQAIQLCGAVDAVRGVSATVEELSYIMQHSNSSALFVQDMATLKKLAPILNTAPFSTAIRFVVVLWGEEGEEDAVTDGGVPMPPVYTFTQVLELGGKQSNAASTTNTATASSADSLATLVYTSGTTGSPKGVQLTHSNILYQVNNFPAFLTVQPGSKTLSILPPWHIYERTVSYHILSRGSCQVYSAIKKFKDDLGTYQPDHLVCVPLVLDTLRSRVLATLKKASLIRKTLAMSLLSASIAYTRACRIVNGEAVEYSLHAAPFTVLFKSWILSILLKPLNWLAQKLVLTKIRSALGIKKCVVSGGGSLAPHIDDFFEAVGVPVLNGYGLTETSPVLACRAMNTTATTTTVSSKSTNSGNIRGTVGRAIPQTQFKIVNPEDLKESYPDGTQGLILVRGPGVMKGYYNNESATSAAFRAGDGWFDTGDLGWIVPSTTAPAPARITASFSSFLFGKSNSNKMAGCLVLTGRAKDTIVLNSGENVEPQPIEDALCSSPFIKFAAVIGQGRRSLGALIVPDTDALDEVVVDKAAQSIEIEKIIKAEVKAACEHRVRWEHVSAFTILEKPFCVEDGTLTKTMKIRRAVIHQVYKEEIAEVEAKLR